MTGKSEARRKEAGGHFTQLVADGEGTRQSQRRDQPSPFCARQWCTSAVDASLEHETLVFELLRERLLAALLATLPHSSTLPSDSSAHFHDSNSFTHLHTSIRLIRLIHTLPHPQLFHTSIRLIHTLSHPQLFHPTYPYTSNSSILPSDSSTHFHTPNSSTLPSDSSTLPSDSSTHFHTSNSSIRLIHTLPHFQLFHSSIRLIHTLPTPPPHFHPTLPRYRQATIKLPSSFHHLHTSIRLSSKFHRASTKLASNFHQTCVSLPPNFHASTKHPTLPRFHQTSIKLPTPPPFPSNFHQVHQKLHQTSTLPPHSHTFIKPPSPTLSSNHRLRHFHQTTVSDTPTVPLCHFFYHFRHVYQATTTTTIPHLHQTSTFPTNHYFFPTLSPSHYYSYYYYYYYCYCYSQQTTTTTTTRLLDHYNYNRTRDQMTRKGYDTVKRTWKGLQDWGKKGYKTRRGLQDDQHQTPGTGN